MALITHVENFVFEIENFLSAEECDEWIGWSEQAGFEKASIHTEDGVEIIDEIRNNDRLVLDDFGLAQKFWQRLSPVIPDPYRGKAAVGVNERFRFYRYEPGQKFDWHKDGVFERADGHSSQMTFMVYLNDNFTGGTTSFTAYNSPFVFDDVTVRPRKGSALVFYHHIFHRGDEVESGRKYVIRSDIMY